MEKEWIQKKVGSGRKIKNPGFEQKLLDFMQDFRGKGIGLSTKRFIAYARSESKKRFINQDSIFSWLASKVYAKK